MNSHVHFTINKSLYALHLKMYLSGKILRILFDQLSIYSTVNSGEYCLVTIKPLKLDRQNSLWNQVIDLRPNKPHF